MTPDISKLPKWAQMHIEKLEADLKHELNKRVLTLGGSLVSAERLKIEGPCVLLEPYAANPIRLDADTDVCFKLGERWDTEIKIDMRQNGSTNYLEVYATRNVRILPASSNTFKILLDD